MPKLGRRSERTGLEYQMAPDVLRKDAPFGTTDTPAITMKIIGGRQVPVIEKHATYTPEYMGSRIQPLRPIADKPNHVDPRTHGDMPGGYYKRDVQDNGSPGPTTVAARRPDSKDVVRSQYKALPPIQLNRTRNDMSTVFEAEPWTDRRAPALADETEYKQNYFTGQSMNGGMDDYHQSGSKDHYFVSESEKNNLFMLVPRNVLLPVDPIRLTRDQETVLCKLICNDLLRFNPKELRDVYVECSQHDKELRGFCGIEILDNNLRRHKAFLSDTLRIVAAQFVDPNYPGKVNYEKVLSFLGSALDLNDKGQLPSEHLTDRSSEKQPKYYMQNGETYKTGSIYRDREVAKLLRMVEQELSKNTYTMDWTRWQNAFYERDRDHRETLSGAQIKDICYDQKLPLSDSLINQILTLCEDNNRDGQYRWSTFLEFLSRVRPSNTGLPIPVSKRPLEYAKHYPEPVPNWPRTDADTEQRRDVSPRRQDMTSPRRGQDDREGRSSQRVPSRYNRPNSYVDPQRLDMGFGPTGARQRPLSYRDPASERYGEYRRDGRDAPSYRGGGGYGRSQDNGPPSQRPTREQQIHQLSQQLRNLETKYEVTRDAMHSNEMPWLDRYLKLAQALYNSDITNKGSLPRKDVMDIVDQYNNAFSLNLDTARANMLAVSPENLDKSGNILLRPFLASLSADRGVYK